MNPFDYNFKPSDSMIADMEKIRAQCKYLASDILNSAPEGRERSLALTNLEQAAMWANKAISHREPQSL